jgi:amino acid adenylation domain-containing protein
VNKYDLILAMTIEQPTIPSPKDFIPLPMEAVNGSFVGRFQEIARLYPNNVAIISETEEVTYRDLNSRSNCLANEIVRLYDCISEPVIFILDHAPVAITTMVGVMKSGKAYVPVDPTFPINRITHILKDTQTRLVITNNHQLEIARVASAGLEDINILNIDDLNLDSSYENPELTLHPTDLAYILYTSGSTGLPKGVMHSHQDAIHNSFSLGNDLKISSSDRFFLFINFGFEASRFAIFSSLLSGATLCLYDIRQNGLVPLPAWIVEEKITLIFFTPSTFRSMFDFVPDSERFSTPRLVILGGESVHSQDIRLFNQHFSKDCFLVNTYGTTETGVVSRNIIDQRTQLTGHRFPAGYPTGDKQILLVNEHGQPVQIGQVGEILLKTHYLFPGYWKQTDLTNEKISVDPKDRGARIFHTGDLGQLMPNGCLEHLGRIDSQVKIRGFRVDTSAIEALLQTHPDVQASVVIAREIPVSNGEKQLVAYIVPRGKPTPTRQDLQQFLGKDLPDYMVPPVIAFLESLPYTTTGKVNPQLLPSLEELQKSKEREFISPHDEIEAQLVKIWERVLKRQLIGVQDDYFELGGSSLTAAQLFAQIEKVFHKKLPLATLFQSSTIARQAEILRQENWTPDWSSLVPLRAGGEKPPLYFAAPVGGNVLSYHDLLLHLPHNLPCFGLQAVGLDGVQLPQRNINTIIDNYLQEVLSFQPEGPYYLLGSSFGGIVAYEMAQKLHDLGKSVALVVMFDAYGPNYPRRKPGVSRLRRRFYKVMRRIDTHLGNLAATNWRGRILYFRLKGQKLYNRFQRWLSQRFDQIMHPLPLELRKIRSAHMGVAKKKNRRKRELRRFGGRLVLFRAAKQPLGIYPDPTLGWSKVAGDDIEIYEIPGHHTSIIYEPRVSVLAEKLNRILTETPPDSSNQTA